MTSFNEFFSADFFVNSDQKNTHLTAYTTQTYSKQAVVPPFRLSLCLEPISMSLSPDLHCPFLSKTRLKYYFNTAHCYQDLHCSSMFRCPTAVLDSGLSLKITRDTAKIGVPL
ncbi:hypothetical protein I503_02508 [Candida albicans SC5314]|nr:hypothetical protein W5Q_04572 [Candida albicans SC5314]KHC87488.1 hypothetical protein I503_02508 [Candida albicans SC5314]